MEEQRRKKEKNTQNQYSGKCKSSHIVIPLPGNALNTQMKGRNCQVSFYFFKARQSLRDNTASTSERRKKVQIKLLTVN
jgi:hypothetical protein